MPNSHKLFGLDSKMAAILSLLLFTVVVCDRVTGQQRGTPNFEERDRGIDLYKQGEIKAAVKMLKTAAKKNKVDAYAWYYLGLAQVRDEDFKNARKAFETAIRLQPQFAASHTGLAYTLMQAGKNQEAASEVARALELDQNDAKAHYVLGVLRLHERNNTAAVQEASTAIGLSPKLAVAYLLKSEALVNSLGEEAELSSRIVSTTNQTDEEERKRKAAANRLVMKEAADALENYLKLNPQSRQAAVWREQLDSLRVFSRDAPKDDPNCCFSSNEVTTKVRVLAKPEPTYTVRAREAGIVGTTILRALFSSDGAVKHILVIRRLPYGLTDQAIAAARKIKFIPATKDGKPVSMFMELQYNFNLY